MSVLLLTAIIFKVESLYLLQAIFHSKSPYLSLPGVKSIKHVACAILPSSQVSFFKKN